jgi:hypothetical protein
VDSKQRTAQDSVVTGSLLFNPSQATTDELEKTFVGRQELLHKLEQDLLQDQRVGTPRHWQIIGPRGSGKSHFTELLSRHMRTVNHWRVARLPEENYQVGSLGELLEQILMRSENIAISPLLSTSDDGALQERCLDQLRAARQRSGKVLLVILENLASIFERQLKATRDQARLRDILTNSPPFVLVATSTSQSPATTKHSAPFYEFFQTIGLDDLSQAEITQLVHARAAWENNTALLADFRRVKGRVEAIYHLSGGNPRLALALYRVVQNGVTTELHDQILKLLDEVTPYYQARLNDIPSQAARVLTEMAVADSVIAPAEVARRCRMPTNQVTAHIRKLLDERLITQGGRPNGRSQLYELKDRLLRIWLQMRESGGASTRLKFLAEFFERWYANRTAELEAFSRRTVSDFWAGLVIGDDRQCSDRLKTLSYLVDVRPGSGGWAVLRAMSAQVDESTHADVRAHVESLNATFGRASELSEREAVALLLSECFIALDAETESERVLKTVIDEGSRSDAIVGRYLSALVAGDAFQEAWNFGDRWHSHHPNHRSILFPLAIAACGVGKTSQAFLWIEESINERLCQHCTEGLLRRSLVALRKSNAGAGLEREFWQRFLAGPAKREASSADIEAVFDILTNVRLKDIPVESFVHASNVWDPLSSAPSWLLGKSVCGLSHRHGGEGHALRFISAIADHNAEPLSQFVVDHLVEIMPALRNRRAKNEAAMRRFLKASALVRSRTTPASLSKAFRRNAPHIAKRYRKIAADVMELYKEWLDERLLQEPMTPYAEVLEVMSSSDPAKVLQSLHPESREAVEMLIDATRFVDRIVEQAEPA